MKVTLIGGAGVRTPLLVHGLLRSGDALGVDELTLFDPDRERLSTIAALCRTVAAAEGRTVRIATPASLEEALAGAAFIVVSIRVGGMAARARDERVAMREGLTGQETTGPGGAAMALRTIPVLLELARVIERHAPAAWVVSFTNPAGLITQALVNHTALRVVGICDTPGELLHQIRRAVGDPAADCEYLGLNHLGWVRAVRCAGEDRLDQLLADDEKLRALYPAQLFDPELLRGLRLLPTEYLFFYYERERARMNQQAVDRSRGEELERLNVELFERLRACADERLALELYRDYLRRRSASYLQLEARAGTALGELAGAVEDPFEAANGYHRVAVQVMEALAGARPGRLIVNALNRGAVADLADDDVVELPCRVDAGGVSPAAAGRLPDAVRGLALSVKAYERQLIEAALRGSRTLARLALLHNPLIGDWELAGRLLDGLVAADPEHLGHLR